MKTFLFTPRGKNKNLTLACVIIVILFSLGGIFLLAKQTVAEIYFQVGARAVNASGNAEVNANKAKALFQSAVKWNPKDTYYEALAQVDVYIVNQIVSNSSTTPTQETVATIGSLITEGIDYARKAESLDPANSYNYIIEASVSEAAASLKIKNAYENAKAAYSKALQLDPFNPSTYLSLAKLDYFSANTDAAKTDLNAAVQLKPDYADAFLEAGIISYQDADYQTAESSFVKVLQIDTTNANAAYFLGLTLARLGDTKNAITELTNLLQAYPNNSQISAVLNDLKEGRSPFGAATQTIVPQTIVSNIASSTKATTTTSATASTTIKTSTKKKVIK